MVWDTILDMLSRRKFFSSLPAAALALTSTAKAEPVSTDSVDPWVELTCQREAIRDWVRTGPTSFEPTGRILNPACGQKFKVLRGATPICPKCGALQNISTPELREKFIGVAC